jgi:hypothetical protein
MINTILQTIMAALAFSATVLVVIGFGQLAVRTVKTVGKNNRRKA